MKPAIALAFAVLTFPAVIAAQNSSPATPDAAKSHPTVGTTLIFNAGTVQLFSCPVSMQAKQGSGSGLVMVRKSQSEHTEPTTPKPGQRIHLILGKMPGADFTDPEQIAGATVTVKGLSARDHLDLTLDSSGNAPSDLHRTMSVAFSIENDGSVTADLNLPGFTAVNSIKLDSVNLKDGSTWTLADVKTCVVTPDRMMLVANQ
jgi:hypothetical protein